MDTTEGAARGPVLVGAGHASRWDGGIVCGHC